MCSGDMHALAPADAHGPPGRSKVKGLEFICRATLGDWSTGNNSLTVTNAKLWPANAPPRHSGKETNSRKPRAGLFLGGSFAFSIIDLYSWLHYFQEMRQTWNKDVYALQSYAIVRVIAFGAPAIAETFGRGE